MNADNTKSSLLGNTSNHRPTYNEIVTNLDHIKDGKNYTYEINKNLPKLHDQLYPPSNKEMIFIKQDLYNLEGSNDWVPSGIGRGIELGRMQSSMFYNQIMVKNMTVGWNIFYKL